MNFKIKKLRNLVFASAFISLPIATWSVSTNSISSKETAKKINSAMSLASYAVVPTSGAYASEWASINDFSKNKAYQDVFNKVIADNSINLFNSDLYLKVIVPKMKAVSTTSDIFNLVEDVLADKTLNLDTDQKIAIAKQIIKNIMFGDFISDLGFSDDNNQDKVANDKYNQLQINAPLSQQALKYQTSATEWASIADNTTNVVGRTGVNTSYTNSYVYSFSNQDALNYYIATLQNQTDYKEIKNIIDSSVSQNSKYEDLVLAYLTKTSEFVKKLDENLWTNFTTHFKAFSVIKSVDIDSSLSDSDKYKNVLSSNLGKELFLSGSADSMISSYNSLPENSRDSFWATLFAMIKTRFNAIPEIYSQEWNNSQALIEFINQGDKVAFSEMQQNFAKLLLENTDYFAHDMEIKIGDNLNANYIKVNKGHSIDGFTSLVTDGSNINFSTKYNLKGIWWSKNGSNSSGNVVGLEEDQVKYFTIPVVKQLYESSTGTKSFNYSSSTGYYHDMPQGEFKLYLIIDGKTSTGFVLNSNMNPWNSYNHTSTSQVWLSSCNGGEYDECYNFSPHYVTSTSTNKVIDQPVFDFSSNPIITDGNSSLTTNFAWSNTSSSTPTSGSKALGNSINSGITGLVNEIYNDANSKLEELEGNFASNGIDLTANHTFNITINKIRIETIDGFPGSLNKEMEFQNISADYSYTINEIPIP